MGRMHGDWSGEMSLDQAHEVLFSDLPMCGCGVPQDVFGLLVRMLRGIGDLRMEGGDFSAAWKALEETVEDHTLRYLVWYVLDHAQLTDHGGSVPGFLTDKGWAFLAACDRYGLEAVLENEEPA